MALGPRAVVQAPRPAFPRMGLVASALGPPQNEDDRWLNGFAYAPENCAGAGAGEACNPDDVEKSVPTNLDEVAFIPFVVYAGDRCSPFELGRDWPGRARRLLEASEQYQIEAEFWSGAIAQNHNAGLAGDDPDRWPNRYLADNSQADVLNVAPTFGSMDATNALACLERALGECGQGQRGMIHATREVVTIWTARNLITREGNLLVSPNDNIVVPGTGYDGSGPDGQPGVDGRIWAYATDMVTVRRGPVLTLPTDIREALDRSDNTVTYWAERLAAATFDGCCHAAIAIDAPACDIGGAGS